MSVHRCIASTRRRPFPVRLAVVVICACTALLAVCGCTSTTAGGGSASGSPTPTPVPSPAITSGRPPAGAVDVVRLFWSQVGHGAMQEARNFSIAPGSPLLDWTGDDIAAAKLVRLLPGYTVATPNGATMTFGAEVWVRPTAGPTPWGETGTHTLFISVVRMSDDTWRMWAVNTSP